MANKLSNYFIYIKIICFFIALSCIITIPNCLLIAIKLQIKFTK